MSHIFDFLGGLRTISKKNYIFFLTETLLFVVLKGFTVNNWKTFYIKIPIKFRFYCTFYTYTRQETRKERCSSPFPSMGETCPHIYSLKFIYQVGPMTKYRVYTVKLTSFNEFEIYQKLKGIYFVLIVIVDIVQDLSILPN